MSAGMACEFTRYSSDYIGQEKAASRARPRWSARTVEASEASRPPTRPPHSSTGPTPAGSTGRLSRGRSRCLTRESRPSDRSPLGRRRAAG